MPSAGPLLRSDFPKLYASRLAYIRELIGHDDWPEADNQWERYFTIVTSQKMREEWLMYGGFGLFNSMTENDSVPYDQMVQGPSKAITHTQYGKGFQIGWLMAKQDLDGIIARNAPALGYALRQSIQTLAASFWNGAFATYTTADGQYYFDTDHTYLRGGGTWSNRSSTAAALGHTALETALVAFRRFKDLEGNPQPLQAQTLLVPPELEPIAFELLQSRMRSDTTQQAANYLNGKVGIEAWPYLTSSTAWHVLGPKEHRKVYWSWNVRPETSSGFDFDKGAAKTKTLFVSSFVAVDPRGAYGSPGA